VANKQRKGFDRAGSAAAGKPVAGSGAASAKSGAGSGTSSQARTIGILVAVLLVAVVAIGGIVLATRGGSGGTITNISADQLATELKTHNFTFLNVKTPYLGEIDGTDLYIPYDQIASRASELPADKTAKIVVYCRSGNESGIASKTLLGMGYTNIENLDGGMNAWQSSGRQIIQKNRS
jgi:rhodanese-related sulfurtransferase